MGILEIVLWGIGGAAAILATLFLCSLIRGIWRGFRDVH